MKRSRRGIELRDPKPLHRRPPGWATRAYTSDRAARRAQRPRRPGRRAAEQPGRSLPCRPHGPHCPRARRAELVDEAAATTFSGAGPIPATTRMDQGRRPASDPSAASDSINPSPSTNPTRPRRLRAAGRRGRHCRRPATPLARGSFWGRRGCAAAASRRQPTASSRAELEDQAAAAAFPGAVLLESSPGIHHWNRGAMGLGEEGGVVQLAGRS